MNHNFKKHFGQNFLQSEYYLHEILNVINPTNQELILEVGPGDGSLTEKLIDSEATIISIEIDRTLYTGLKEKFLSLNKKNNWSLVEDDILNLELNNFGATKLVGNLPYNISKKIISNFLNSNIETGVFLIQKEVAEDYSGKVPNSTSLANIVQSFGSCEYLLTVPKKHFFPAPKVDGGLIKIVKNTDLNFENRDKLIKFIHAMFASPRKTIGNNLKNYLSSFNENIGRDEIERILSNLQIKLTSRPQEIEFKNFIAIFEMISKQSNDR
ncbi:ribosomal RNA small subunit methyltransferase A [bacterium]|nr:MAG: ribosomal RNA small subunit methyltransferase A [bacterium]